MTLTFALICLFIAVATKASASTKAQLKHREHRQLHTLHADRGTLRFCRNHPRARVFCTAHRLRFTRARIGWTTRELAETRALLNPFRVPAWWLPGALCVHRGESTDWHILNPPYAGGMQFTLGTFNEAGGHAASLYEVSRRSPAEQLYRAYVIVRKRGHWGDWPNTSRVCGLR